MVILERQARTVSEITAFNLCPYTQYAITNNQITLKIRNLILKFLCPNTPA